MFSDRDFDLLSAAALLLAIVTLVTVIRKGRSFWRHPVNPQDRRLIQQIAIFLVHPFIVPIHEFGHVVATWMSGGTILEFQWRVFWGFVVPFGGFTEFEHWWISFAGNLASAVVGLVLLLVGYRMVSLKPAFRAIAQQAGYFELIFTFVIYPLMSFGGAFGDWRVIYRFDETPLASALVLVVHVGIVLLLLSPGDRIKEALRPTRPGTLARSLEDSGWTLVRRRDSLWQFRLDVKPGMLITMAVGGTGRRLGLRTMRYSLRRVRADGVWVRWLDVWHRAGWSVVRERDDLHQFRHEDKLGLVTIAFGKGSRSLGSRTRMSLQKVFYRKRDEQSLPSRYRANRE